MWTELILKYCKHHKEFVLSTDAAEDHPLFVRKSIDRRLNQEARVHILNELVLQGAGRWLDAGQRRCLVLWRPLAGWADAIYGWARGAGLEDSVTTVDELSSGDEVAGTELEGLPRELVIAALQELEARGKARLFKGSSADDEGVKFFA
ncbi:hypothetical protein WJX81_008499 [Elliptochloris bilobata]|uniref:ESCRT-II complex subunit VPS25 n=1 Tax=Elliptochloris bilobata TaxID=381761 RepID=A0AAW1QCX5_9CHLO